MAGEDKANRIPNTRILKVKIFEIRPPNERLRHDIGDTDQLSMMIRMFGWISPMVVTEDMRRLVAGLRRLEALKKASADHVEAQVVPNELAWIVEGLENVEREQLNWFEKSSFEVRLNKHMRQRFGENPNGGRPIKQPCNRDEGETGDLVTGFSGPWSDAKSAALLGFSKTKITRDKELVDYAKRHVDVKDAPNRKKALQIVRQIKKKEEFERVGQFPFVPKIHNI